MKKRGFTIMELLVVISIIALLIGIMVPGVRKAKQVAMNLKQKCQLREIGIGLELWSNENDNEFPDSKALGTALFTTGAHHLAEAMLGRDGQGFDSLSTWDADADFPGDAYDVATFGLAGRESPYLNPEQFGHFQLAQIYGDTGATGFAYPGDWEADGTTAALGQAGVMTDIFKNRKVIMPSSGDIAKSGSPILYFKAKDTDTFIDTFPDTSVFNWNDNADILALGHNMTNPIDDPHPWDDVLDFYSPESSLINRKIRRIGDPVPYNKRTFLLMSAGKDGLYGTKDDIFNISR